MEGYKNNIIANVPAMPDPVKDFKRFSTLHSWYKHLNSFNIAYPVLMKGEEPRYSFDTSFSDSNQENYHWRFIVLDNLEAYGYILNGQEANVIPKDVLEFMKKYPIYISNRLGNEESDEYKFQITVCANVCKLFWDDLMSCEVKDININTKKIVDTPNPGDVVLYI